VAFVPHPLPPSLDWDRLKVSLFDKHSEALLAIGRLNGLHKRLHDGGPLLRTLWMREAKLSTAVEDIHTTAEEMVLAGALRGTPVRSGGHEAWSYVQALEHGLKSVLPLSRRLMCEMHRILLSGGIGEVRGARQRPGDLRDIPVYIGDDRLGPRMARFVPPPPGDVLEKCMRELEMFANKESRRIPSLVSIALFHYQFESIHPFRDGNGRIGRVLMSRSLVTEGLLDHPVVYFSGYIYRRKQEYIDRMFAVSARGEWIEWIDFVLDAILTQALDAIARSERLIELREHFYTTLKRLDASARVFKLVDRLFAMPAVNAEEAREIMGVEKPTAYKDIALLEKAGVLTEITGRVRDRDWVARDVVKIIETDPFDESPEITAPPTSS